MKEYRIEIKETLVKTVTIEAENAIQAQALAERGWQNGEHMLGSEHFKGVVFSTLPPKTRER